MPPEKFHQCIDLSLLDDPFNKPFHGCDGSPWSDDFLQYHIEEAVSEENYEFAAECRDELARRKSL
jgi:hypothetical protein